jgi:hypothetical protein
VHFLRCDALDALYAQDALKKERLARGVFL